MVRALTLERVMDSRRRSKAMEAWTDLQTLRTIASSIADGIDQASIASALGISQPAVSNLARRARAMPDLSQRMPREVILERTIGMIDSGEMMRQLDTWIYPAGRFVDASVAEPESYVPGLRDQLERAAGERLLSRAEFEQLTTVGTKGGA